MVYNMEKYGINFENYKPEVRAVLYNVLKVPKKITWNQGWTHGWSPSGMDKWTVDGGFDAAVTRDRKAPGLSAPTTITSGTLANP